MNYDIRIKVGFHRHPKFRKLRKELGAEGPLSLIVLWGYTAQNRPDGNLTGMDAEDIELAAEWEGEQGKFVRVTHSLRLLDKVGKDFVVHDWPEHNAYAAAAPFRSEKARKAALTRWGADATSIPEHCPEHKQAMPVAPLSNAPSPSPSPAPSPAPSEDQDRSQILLPGAGEENNRRSVQDAPRAGEILPLPKTGKGNPGNGTGSTTTASGKKKGKSPGNGTTPRKEVLPPLPRHLIRQIEKQPAAARKAIRNARLAVAAGADPEAVVRILSYEHVVPTALAYQVFGAGA